MIDLNKNQNEEPSQEEIQQYIDDVYNYAADLIVNKGYNYEDAKKQLVNQGVDSEGAETVIKNIKEQIKEQKSQNSSDDIKWGLIWACGGILLTLITGGTYIFWGAVVYGGYRLIKGLIN